MTVEYHQPDTCNKCGRKTNEYTGSLLYNDEFPTKCSSCGHEDYWAYGFFESSENGYDECEKYTTT